MPKVSKSKVLKESSMQTDRVAVRDAVLSRSRTVGKRKSLMRQKPNEAVQTSIALTELATFNEERTSAMRF